MEGHEDQPSEGDLAPSSRPDFGAEFFEGMVAAASDAVVTADAEGTIVYANEAVENLLGYAPEDLIGAKFTEFVPERFEDRYESWHRRYAEGEDGTPLSDETVELTWQTADGEEQPLSMSSFEHRDDGRRLVTGFLREAPERDAADERLRAEEALVREIFDTSPIAITVRDADGELLRANDRAAELVGVGATDVPSDVGDYEGTGEWVAYDEDGDPLPRDAVPAVRAVETAETVLNEELVVERPDGSRVWLSVNATPIGTDGEVRQVVTTAEDVTELKETQHALERRRAELETELSEVFARIDDAFFALNDDWEFTYVNDVAGELLRRTEGELLGKNIWEAFPDAVDSTFEREYRSAMATQEQASFVEYYPPLSAWFEVRAYPSETGLSVYFRDVTDRIEREQELERYETIVETVEDGIYVMNEDMELTMVNSAISRMSGYDREELIGTPVWEFVDHVQHLREDIEALDVEMFEGERDAATIEVDIATADGDTFPAEATWVVRDSDDGYERVGVVRDVTQRKARERELQNRVQQQRAIAEFSQRALEDKPLDDLFDEAVELVADTLDHDYCKVLELSPEDDELLLRAGVGWREGIVGEATVADDGDSQAGYTLISDEPVVVEDLETEDRFAGPDLLTSHDVRSGISTIIGSSAAPWGILGTFDTARRSYADHDVQFVQSMAHILTTAIRRREREQQLERYETIVETVDDGVYALNSDEQFVMVNDAFCEMTGYDREELLGEHASTVHSEAVSERAAEMSRAVAAEMGSVTLEVELRTKGGDTVPVESRFGPYRYDDEEFARTGVVRDITDRKRFEQTLTALHESSRELLQLEKADAVCESALQTTTDVLGIPGASIYLWDEAASQLLPAAASEYVEDNFGELPSFEPGDEAITWQAFAEGETITLDDVADTDLAYRDDTPLRSGLWIPLGDHGVLAVVSDEVDAFDPDEEKLADLLAATTEAALDRVERERERREHERKLEAQNERLDAFASMLAHELRNPLEIAQIYLGMGVERAVEDDADASAFEEVETALDRIEEMIETLLVVTRRDGAVDTTEVVDLGEVAVEWWENIDPDGRLSVETDRKIRADESRLHQLLENLYRNAVEHGSTSNQPEADDAEEHAGPNVTVRVGDLDGGFFVEDDGPGIPAEERGQVFEPGYSTSNVGIGFGLAVVSQLVEAHGWDCEITESPEGGARFEFTGVETVKE
jgi:PAS domain S-box-containing protein